MKRMPLERPTEHYDERIVNIDEQICALLKQRKESSDHNPGFPPLEHISGWANSFELYEDFLKAVFGVLRNEEHFRPIADPSGFRKHIPILKSIEQGELFYSVNSVRQYNNASVITFSIDWDITTDLPENPHNHSYFELYLGEEYDSRMTNGGRSSGHSSYCYVISPPLPDDLSGFEFKFREYGAPFNNKPTGIEVVFQIE
ncbi:hypothetical protein K0U00_24675 [Paenibacillus sepulcri]|uniref:Uncharacterized protein n=2 Tax=Paenibacillus sepulcri TaxID=359917 RepID=A0ABS7C8I5_9BACL|nr:hypothetical protein [Paenibacillus sepulcri]